MGNPLKEGLDLRPGGHGALEKNSKKEKGEEDSSWICRESLTTRIRACKVEASLVSLSDSESGGSPKEDFSSTNPLESAERTHGRNPWDPGHRNIFVTAVTSKMSQGCLGVCSRGRICKAGQTGICNSWSIKKSRLFQYVLKHQ